jgi:hypothetical protein
VTTAMRLLLSLTPVVDTVLVIAITAPLAALR